MKEKENITKKHLPRLLRSLPFKVASWEFMNEGVWHDTYLLITEDRNAVVLKIPKKALANWEKNIKRERWLLKKLESDATHLAPSVVYTDFSKKIVPFSFQVLSFVEGKKLQKTSGALKELASVLRTLRGHTFPKWGGFPPRKSKFTFDRYALYRFSDQINRLPAATQQQLRPVFAQIAQELRRYECRQIFCITHGDINTRNFLRAKTGELVLIDWEMADACPPARDLADLFVIERFSEKQQQDFLRVYGDSSEQMQQEIFVFEKLVRFAELLDDLEMGKRVILSIQRNVLRPLAEGR